MTQRSLRMSGENEEARARTYAHRLRALIHL